MGVVVCFSPHPQRPVVPIDTLPCHPGGGDARVEGALQHLLRSRWLGRQETLRGNPRALAARWVVGPLLGERACTIEPHRALGTRLGRQYPHWAMCHAACCPPLLASHPRRMRAFVEASRLIDDQHGLRVPQMLDPRGPQSIAEGLSIPRRPAQQRLDPIWRGLAVDFGHLPAIVPLSRTPQGTERRPRTPSDCAPGTLGPHPSFSLRPPQRPCAHHRKMHVSQAWVRLLPPFHGSVLQPVLGTMITYNLQL